VGQAFVLTLVPHHLDFGLHLQKVRILTFSNQLDHYTPPTFAAASLL
jgi:hypothetical protein